MRNGKKALVGGALLFGIGVVGVAVFLRSRDRPVEVRTEVIERRDLAEIITASGNIRARRTIDMSSDISARVAELLIDEGDDVHAGQILLRLDPEQYRAALSRAEASLAQARAQEAQQQANLTQARRDLDRLLQLRSRDSLLVSRQQLDDAETRVEVQQALLQSASFGVSQARAGVEEAQDLLSKTVFAAPISGKVTRLNVEEGETVIIGTMNNPGSLVLTISDLSVIEAVLQVDETDVSEISLGDSASIRIDAFPDRTFQGHVTQIGNSAINPPSGQDPDQQAAIDFEVVLTLDKTDATLRPDLSATAEIIVERRADALAVPIIALTVRDRDDVGVSGTDAVPRGGRLSDVEGVFVTNAGTVRFTPIDVGIAGQEYFEVLSGLREGDTVVAGPYQRIRELSNGDAIEVQETETDARGG